MTRLLLYFFFSHLFSFICSIFEAVLLSVTPTHIGLMKRQGSQAAAILDDLKAKVDRPLAAILTVNTVSHTFGAAGVGAGIVEVFGPKWLPLGSVILTMTMLYFTEMFPKTIGALYWRSLAPICARPIRFLITLTYPFVVSFNFFAKFLSKGKKSERITEEEIKVALEAGARAGVIEEAEQEMVENIFRLSDRPVGVLMLPRVDIVWLDLADDPKEISTKIASASYHRFPLCDGEIDKVVGVVDTPTLLRTALAKEPLHLRKLAKPPLYVQENLQVFELLELFKKTEAGMALVTDEYGGIQGLITKTEILSAILRDIDVGTRETGRVLEINPSMWLIDGSVPIDEFKEIFHLSDLPREEQARYRTVSGLVMAMLESIPKVGDRFRVNGLELEVLKAARRRAEKILVTFQSE